MNCFYRKTRPSKITPMAIKQRTNPFIHYFIAYHYIFFTKNKLYFIQKRVPNPVKNVALL
jgi:hypothetical protein